MGADEARPWDRRCRTDDKLVFAPDLELHRDVIDMVGVAPEWLGNGWTWEGDGAAHFTGITVGEGVFL